MSAEIELRVTMPDGSVWAVPALVIAQNRARYYAKDNEAEFAKEVAYCMGDDYEIEDWAANNMDWSDVANVALRVKQPETDYEEGWANGRKRVVRERPTQPEEQP